MEQAWPRGSEAPGLLAAGDDLSVARLRQAYAQCTFPWFSEGQPVLWWSPDPRMVLDVGQFRLHRSLRKKIAQLVRMGRLVIRMDHDFAAVIRACAHQSREGQDGTWIVPPMVQAYEAWHAAGDVHSVEAWVDGELAGGLYGVNLGRAFFGESMFTRQTDGSKIALAALVAFCRSQGITHVDCQQNTPHLAFMGAREMPRAAFAQLVRKAMTHPAPSWQFHALYWQALQSAD
nr:leucyl/phenylalanyl-tRNA--protein transferase [Comamonas serinivorans]